MWVSIGIEGHSRPKAVGGTHALKKIAKKYTIMGVTKKQLIQVLFINIVVLFVFIDACISYNHRQAIINTERPIENFSVLETDCRSNRSGSSILLVEFNGKKYHVGVTYDQCKSCKSFTLDKVKIYYDKENDKLFERDELAIRIVVFYFILYLCSFIWLITVIKKKYIN